MAKWDNILDIQSEEEFFEDYVREALTTPAPSLPPAEQKIGTAMALWHETEPGIARISCSGGNSPDDRAFALFVLGQQLRGHGYRIAQYELDWDHSDTELIKTAGWGDVEAKAKRLLQSGNVQILRNGRNTIVGYVQGDHGNYQTEISRDDPESMAITTWQCECPWDQFAWQRTRQWKKYEGRVCSHVLATFWGARSLPLDEDAHPSGGGPQGGPQGQPSLFDMPQSPATPIGGPPRGPAPAPQGEQMQLPFQMQGPVQMPQPQPQGPDIIPQFPMDPNLQPEVNPVSVPGQKQPTPLNPVQYPGGTFSSVQDGWVFKHDPDMIWHMGAVPPNEDFANSSMVQFKEEDVGIAEGKSEAHGSGEFRTIPKNSIGEVLGQDPTTGWVDVIVPIHDAGPMEPYHIRGWFEPEKLIPRPDVRRPGPMIRRRR